MIFAVDFDGTIVKNKFPEIGEPLGARIACLKKLKSKGHKLILWTCRCGKALDEAIEFCEKEGIIFDAVNENLPEIKESWGGDTRKVYCDYYIDDRNLPDTALNVLSFIEL